MSKVVTPEWMYRYTISQEKKIKKLLEKEISKILEKVAKDTVNKIKVYIRRYWYNQYQPVNYTRTWSLLNAIEYTIDGNDIHILFNLDNAERKKGKHGRAGAEWGSYTNFQGKSSFTGEFWENMITYIDTGYFPNGTGSDKNPRVGDGSNFMKRTSDWLDKYMRNRADAEIQAQIDKVLTKEWGVKVGSQNI